MEKMYKVKFKKIHSDHDRLRTDEVEGVTRELPTEGNIFVLLCEGLEFGTRCVNTSIVKKVEKNENTYTLHTESGSIYQVDFLGTYL